VVPPSNVLQAIVASKASEPMPVPRPSPAVAPTLLEAMPPSGMPGSAPILPEAMPPSGAPLATQPPPMSSSTNPTLVPGTVPAPQLYPSGFPVGTPGAQQSYNHDASGMPLGIPTPPGVEAHPGAPYPMAMHPGYPQPQMPHGYPQLSPNALYQFQPAPHPMSLTGQMRLFEVDEIPSQYKIGAARRRWFTYIVSGILAVSVAAGVTFLIIRSTRDQPPTTGTLRLESVPSGAAVSFDGTLLIGATPMTIDRVPVGTRHRITIQLPHYKAETRDVDIPNGQEVSIMVQLTTLKGTILVNTVPAGAEIRINGQVRGVTPTKISEVEIESTQSIELRHRDFPPHEVVLKWQADGVAAVDYRFTH
jgi:hypothetical protein